MQAIRRTQAYIREHGWTQKELHSGGSGAVCLVGAFVLANAQSSRVNLLNRLVCDVDGDDYTFYDWYERHPQGQKLEKYIADQIRHYYDCFEEEPADATVKFNDEIARSEQEVLEILDEFIEAHDEALSHIQG
jgi:hypothetical protein